ncbi:MAG: hypothetical protein J6S85_05510 [Methanobrevibacter sp.]|nr:hypothetical protein [Methanobrevibacter sp.]
MSTIKSNLFLLAVSEVISQNSGTVFMLSNIEAAIIHGLYSQLSTLTTYGLDHIK